MDSLQLNQTELHVWDIAERIQKNLDETKSELGDVVEAVTQEILLGHTYKQLLEVKLEAERLNKGDERLKEYSEIIGKAALKIATQAFNSKAKLKTASIAGDEKEVVQGFWRIGQPLWSFERENVPQSLGRNGYYLAGSGFKDDSQKLAEYHKKPKSS